VARLQKLLLNDWGRPACRSYRLMIGAGPPAEAIASAIAGR